MSTPYTLHVYILLKFSCHEQLCDSHSTRRFKTAYSFSLWKHLNKIAFREDFRKRDIFSIIKCLEGFKKWMFFKGLTALSQTVDSKESLCFLDVSLLPSLPPSFPILKSKTNKAPPVLHLEVHYKMWRLGQTKDHLVTERGLDVNILAGEIMS